MNKSTTAATKTIFKKSIEAGVTTFKTWGSHIATKMGNAYTVYDTDAQCCREVIVFSVEVPEELRKKNHSFGKQWYDPQKIAYLTESGKAYRYVSVSGAMMARVYMQNEDYDISEPIEPKTKPQSKPRAVMGFWPINEDQAPRSFLLRNDKKALLCDNGGPYRTSHGVYKLFIPYTTNIFYVRYSDSRHVKLVEDWTAGAKTNRWIEAAKSHDVVWTLKNDASAAPTLVPSPAEQEVYQRELQTANDPKPKSEKKLKLAEMHLVPSQEYPTKSGKMVRVLHYWIGNGNKNMGWVCRDPEENMIFCVNKTGKAMSRETNERLPDLDLANDTYVARQPELIKEENYGHRTYHKKYNSSGSYTGESTHYNYQGDYYPSGVTTWKYDSRRKFEAEPAKIKVED